MTATLKVNRIAEQARLAAKERGLAPLTDAYASFCRGQWAVAVSLDDSLKPLKNQFLAAVRSTK